MNPQVLKPDCYSTTDYWIRRFVRQNKFNLFGNLITAGPSVSDLPKVS